MFAGIIFIMSFFQYESPRYLIKDGKDEAACKTLARLRGLPVDHEYVVSEISTIQIALQTEKEATMGAGWFGILKEIFLDTSNLYRLYIACMGQILSQWSGAGSITLYAPDLFKLLGITGSNESLLVTATLVSSSWQQRSSVLYSLLMSSVASAHYSSASRYKPSR